VELLPKLLRQPPGSVAGFGCLLELLGLQATTPTSAIPTTAIYPLFLHTTKFLRRPNPDPNRTLTLALTLTIAAVGTAAVVVQRVRGSGDDALYELTFPIIPRLHDTTGLTTGLTTGCIV